MTALTDCPVRYRAFSPRSLELIEICRRPTDHREVTHVTYLARKLLKIIIMKPRTIIGIIFIVASLLKLATIWNIIHWNWFTQVTKHPS